jgi:hypothetical protein
MTGRVLLDDVDLSDVEQLEEVLRSTPEFELPDPFEEVLGG